MPLPFVSPRLRQLVIPAAGVVSPPPSRSVSSKAGRERTADSRIVHHVRSGDTLQSIARRYGTSVQALVGLNDIADPAQIRPGQRLLVRAGGAGAAAVPRPTAPGTASASAATSDASGAITYRVHPGDTLYSIARRHNVTVDALRRWNGLGADSLLHAGAELRIVASLPGSRRRP